MSVEDIMTSGILESYVLGAASPEEVALIRSLCDKHPELVSEIEKIEKSLAALAALSAPTLHPDLKHKIIASLSFAQEEKEAVTLALRRRQEKWLKFYKLSIAATALLFITSLGYNMLQRQRIWQLNGELSELRAAKSYLAREIKIQQVSFNTVNQRLKVITAPGVKSIALSGMNSLQDKIATVYWNLKTNEVYINANGLPNSPVSKHYQLWAIVNGQPVDAGVIDIDGGGSVFQKMKSVKGATAFAVTIEPMGGSPAPTLDTMCLIGNV